MSFYPKLKDELIELKTRIKNHLTIEMLVKHINNNNLIENFHDSLNLIIEKNEQKEIDSNVVELYLYKINKIMIFLKSENQISANKIEIVDIMNYFIKEFLLITREEFSNRYDKLINLLKTTNFESNLSLFTKENKEFKLYKHNDSLVIRPQTDKNNLSTTKDNLIKIAYGEKVSNLASYTRPIIEKIFDNTIFDEIINPLIDELQNSTTEGQRIKKLEDDKDKLYGQVKQLEEKLENHINLIENIDEVYKKAISAEENFNNTQESILSKVETNASKSFWNDQATFFTNRYKFYLWTTIITTLILVVLLASYKYYLFSSIINIDSVKLNIKDIIAYGFIVLLISLAIWIIRIFMKIALSSYHLSIDAKERVTMINTYISLMQEGNTITDDDKHIMIQSIFRQTNHGIIKDENSVTVTDIISSFKK